MPPRLKDESGTYWLRAGKVMAAQESFSNAEATTKPAVAEAAASCECSGSVFLLSYMCVCVAFVVKKHL